MLKQQPPYAEVKKMKSLTLHSLKQHNISRIPDQNFTSLGNLFLQEISVGRIYTTPASSWEPKVSNQNFTNTIKHKKVDASESVESWQLSGSYLVA